MTSFVVHEPSLDLTMKKKIFYMKKSSQHRRLAALKRCYLLLTVLACSSCSVAMVSLWVVSISIKKASWLSVISSSCKKHLHGCKKTHHVSIEKNQTTEPTIKSFLNKIKRLRKVLYLRGRWKINKNRFWMKK